MARTLKTIVFVGSGRNVVPPWGGDTRLGDRVRKYVVSELKGRATKFGDEELVHEVTVMDPLEVFAAGGALEGDGHLETPHFFMKPGTKPKMDEMAATIKAADAYVLVSAEYNHSIPPALKSMLDHFGGSNFALKPSACVTYSPSPWGGMRAAMAMRPWLSELGCIPVSKLCAFPMAGDLFNEDGTAKDPEARMLKQLAPMLTQMEWTALAFKKMKESCGEPVY